MSIRMMAADNTRHSNYPSGRTDPRMFPVGQAAGTSSSGCWPLPYRDIQSHPNPNSCVRRVTSDSQMSGSTTTLLK